MGRRALPKIDPALDYSRNFRPLAELPVPWDQATLFGRDAPLEVEMGSGKGLFLQTASAANPAHDFLGVEVSGKYARFAASRLARREIRNAVAVHGDGLRMFHEMLPDASAVAVHVYFPDPWWKARHHKRRVLNEGFLADVVRVLVPHGRLHFWTDVQEYYDATLELIAAKTPLVGPLAVVEKAAEHDLDFRTHFERRTRMHGEPVYRAEFENPVPS